MTSSRPHTPPLHTPSGIFFCLIVALSVFALAYPPIPVLTLIVDSDQYREMAEQLFSGDGSRTHEERSHTPLLRPPLFPLLVGIARSLPGQHLDHALIFLHVVLGGCVLILSPFLLRRTAPVHLAAFAVGLSLYSAKQVAWGIMSEWLAMCCLFTACMFYLSWITATSSRNSLLAAFFLSLAVLTRSALLPFLCLLPFMILQSPPGRRRVTATAISIGLLPLCVWGVVQFSRTGSASFARYEGLNLLATARSFGPIPIKQEDTEMERRVITFINEHGVTARSDDLSGHDVHRWEGPFYHIFHSNFSTSVRGLNIFGASNDIHVTKLATRTLESYPQSYRLFLRGGIRTLLVDYAPLIAICLITTGALVAKARRYWRWALGISTLCVISLGYYVTILGTMLWLHRYTMPVQPVILVCLLTSLGLLLRNVFGRKFTTEN